MTPQTFIAKWQAGGSADALSSERAGAQAHFHDLCELLGVNKPADPDNYCFERGAHRTGAGHGPMSGNATTSPGNTRRRVPTSKKRSGN